MEDDERPPRKSPRACLYGDPYVIDATSSSPEDGGGGVEHEDSFVLGSSDAGGYAAGVAAAAAPSSLSASSSGSLLLSAPASASASGGYRGDVVFAQQRGYAEAYSAGFDGAAYGGATSAEADGDDGCGEQQRFGGHVEVPTSPPPEFRREGMAIDWNSRYLEIMAEPDGTDDQRMRKCQSICTLYNNFLHVALTFGKIIISEVYHSDHVRTISPVSYVPGRAGGMKYFYYGIMFKFVADFNGIYNGDEYAMKAGGHELKGLMRFCSSPKLHVPLMALIDWHGFRLVAMSRLPIDRTTLCYGSDDAGTTTRFSDPALEKLIEEEARRMNLKMHAVGFDERERHWIRTPLDLEGHRDPVSGLYYLVDFARLFPPTADSPTKAMNTFLYQLMRPEFVRTYKKPLSPDAFSKFGDHDAREHDDEVREATRYLLEQEVPSFAHWLDQNFATVPDIEKRLTEFAHRRGINCRYFGAVRRCVRSPEVSRALLLEMVARVARKWLFNLMRVRTKELRTPEEDTYKYIAMNFLNFVLGWQNAGSTDEFWGTALKNKLCACFHGALTAEETSHCYALQHTVDMHALFCRVEALTGIRLTGSAMRELKKNPGGFKVVVADIKRMDPVVKHMNIVSLADGIMCATQAMDQLKQESVQCSERLFSLAMTKFEQAVKATPDDHKILNTYAEYLFERGNAVAGRCPVHLYYDKALTYFHLANNIEEIDRLGAALASLQPLHEEQASILELAGQCQLVITAYDINPDRKLEAAAKYAALCVRRVRCGDQLSLLKEAGESWRGSNDWFRSMAGTLSHEEAAVLVEVWMNNPSFEVFDARWSCVRSNITTQLLLSLCDHMPRLHTMLLGGCAWLVDDSLLEGLAKVTPSLTRLDISDCPRVTNAGLAALLRLCKGVKDLRISGCLGVTSDIYAVFMASAKKLATIDISRCRHLGDVVVGSVATGCPALINVDCSGMLVTEVACLPRSLQRLCISGCKQIAEAPLAAALAGLTALVSLVAQSTNVTDTCLRALGESSRRLEILDVSDCDAVTLDGLLCVPFPLSIRSNRAD
eukprot:m51a1_g11663 hypothetical protein (1053) ;mRNA; r:493-4759